MKTEPQGDLIPIIVRDGAERIVRRKADESGEEQSIGGSVAEFFGVRRRSVADIGSQMTKIVGQMEHIIASIKSTSAGEMELTGVEVGLTMNASGNIGIVSAGVEASITLSFSKPDP